MNHYDVIVMGGGPSGSMAAIAAARQGAKTLLIEKHAFLGGSLTAMGVGPMMSFHNPNGEQVVLGFPEELIQRLISRRASPGHIADTTTYCTSITPFDSEMLKIELETMLTEAGGKLLYHTHFAEVNTEDGKITSITVCNKAGLTDYSATTYVDATGDGDLCQRSGVTMHQGRESDGGTQPMTMNMKVGNVDIRKIREEMVNDPDNFYFDKGSELGLKRLKKASHLGIGAYVKTLAEAKARGEIDIPRDRILFFETMTPGAIIVNTSRVLGMDATNPEDLTQAEMIGRQQCVQIFNFLKTHCSGFENAVRMDAAAQIGVRESRRMEGIHTLTAQDLLEGRSFPDTIALGGYPIDIHSPDGASTDSIDLDQSHTYEIPLRSLLPQGVDNLIVAGRCISATHEAMAAFRVTPIVMAIGQAAGTAAALAAQEKLPLASLPYEPLKKELLANGVRLDPKEGLLPQVFAETEDGAVI